MKIKIFVGIFFLVVMSVLVYASCYDSDGGYNIYELGTCTEKGNFTDYCATSVTLVEYYPDAADRKCISSNVICFEGCSDGACN